MREGGGDNGPRRPDHDGDGADRRGGDGDGGWPKGDSHWPPRGSGQSDLGTRGTGLKMGRGLQVPQLVPLEFG